MIVVTRKPPKGASEQEVLCYSPAFGSFWRSLATETLLGFTSARKFPVEGNGARLAAEMMGGEVTEIPEPGPLPCLLVPQAS